MKNLAQCLSVFSSNDNSRHMTAGRAKTDIAVIEDKKPVGKKEPILEDPVAEAHMRGRNEAIAETEAAFAEERAQWQSQIDEKISDAKTEWQNEFGEVLVTRLGDELQALENRLGDQLGRVLSEIIPNLVLRRTVNEVVETITELPRSEGYEIVISGPDDLVGEVLKKLQHNGIQTSQGDSNEPEIIVRCGEAVIESQIEKWRQILKEVDIGW